MISTYHKSGGKLPGVMKSPLHDVDDTVVELALQRALIKRPFDQEELIEFTNSMIKDTPLQARFLAWQTKTNTREEIRGTVEKNGIVTSRSGIPYLPKNLS